MGDSLGVEVWCPRTPSTNYELVKAMYQNNITLASSEIGMVNDGTFNMKIPPQYENVGNGSTATGGT